MRHRPIWPVYVINLDGATARMASIGSQLESLAIPFERLGAIDGSTLSPDQLAALTTHPLRYKRPLTAGEIGCAVSHFLAWDRIARSDAPVAVVLEDDAVLLPDARGRLEALATHEPEWDLLKTCYDAPASPGPPDRAIIPGKLPFATIGYAVTRAAAAKLLERMVPLMRPIDTQLKYWWEHGACVKILASPLGRACSDHAATSTIVRERARPTGPQRFWSNLLMQAEWQIARRRHAATRPTGRVWPDRGPVEPKLPPVLRPIAGGDG